MSEYIFMRKSHFRHVNENSVETLLLRSCNIQGISTKMNFGPIYIEWQNKYSVIISTILAILTCNLSCKLKACKFWLVI